MRVSWLARQGSAAQSGASTPEKRQRNISVHSVTISVATLTMRDNTESTLEKSHFRAAFVLTKPGKNQT